MKLSTAEVTEVNRLGSLRIAPAIRSVGYAKLASEMADYVSEELDRLEEKENPNEDRIQELDGVHSYFEQAVMEPLLAAEEIIKEALDSEDEDASDEEDEERPNKKQKFDSDDEGDDFGDQLASALSGCGDDFP